MDRWRWYYLSDFVRFQSNQIMTYPLLIKHSELPDAKQHRRPLMWHVFIYHAIQSSVLFDRWARRTRITIVSAITQKC